MERAKEFAVPCGTCQHCCKNEWIFLHPEDGDIVELYDTAEVTNPATGLPTQALRHKPNGDCIYLSASGCSIHGRHPSICRVFDCRRFYLQAQAAPRTERRRQMRDVHRFQETFEIGKRMQEAFPV